MKELIRLARLISKKGSKKIPLFDPNLKKIGQKSEIPFELFFQSCLLNILNYHSKDQHELAAEEIDSLVSRIKKTGGANSCYRTKTFLRLLLLLKKCNFDVSVCRKKGRYLHRRLMSDKQCKFGTEIFEVLPYERLWEYIIDGDKEKRSFIGTETEKHNQ